MTDDSLYFRHLLAGRQVATKHPIAGQMANFMYLVGDPASRQALVVDPAWDVASLIEVAREDGYEVTGALGIHLDLGARQRFCDGLAHLARRLVAAGREDLQRHVV